MNWAILTSSQSGHMHASLAKLRKLHIISLRRLPDIISRSDSTRKKSPSAVLLHYSVRNPLGTTSWLSVSFLSLLILRHVRSNFSFDCQDATGRLYPNFRMVDSLETLGSLIKMALSLSHQVDPCLHVYCLCELPSLGLLPDRVLKCKVCLVIGSDVSDGNFWDCNFMKDRHGTLYTALSLLS
jgi:hypothetical protein